MPYIKKEHRWPIDEPIDSLYGLVTTPGSLNYAITRLVQVYLERTCRKYDDYNTVVGVLECAKQELYRRQIIPYENQKWDENGDAYNE